MEDAVDLFLAKKESSIKQTTLREYRLKLNNQVFSLIPSSTPLKELQWSNGGRQTVREAMDVIADGSKFDLSNRARDYFFRFSTVPLVKDGLIQIRTLPQHF